MPSNRRCPAGRQRGELLRIGFGSRARILADVVILRHAGAGGQETGDNEKNQSGRKEFFHSTVVEPPSLFGVDKNCKLLKSVERGDPAQVTALASPLMCCPVGPRCSGLVYPAARWSGLRPPTSRGWDSGPGARLRLPRQPSRGSVCFRLSWTERVRPAAQLQSAGLAGTSVDRKARFCLSAGLQNSVDGLAQVLG
ncbi:MAG: hypothetical protein QOH01_1425 [Verrucomicrobiota bacterium]